MSRRALAPVIGVVVLVLITVLLAAVVGTMAFGIGPGESSPHAAITGEANGNEIDLTHRSGDALDVTELTIRVFVEGHPLDKQPEVPARNSDGFRHLSGDFSSWGTQPWEAGEDAGFMIASTTNAPQPDPGDRITVRLSTDETTVAVVRMTA